MHTGREFLIDAIEVQGYGPGEEDESQARLAQLQTDRALRAPKEALAVSGRRAVTSDMFMMMCIPTYCERAKISCLRRQRRQCARHAIFVYGMVKTCPSCKF